MLQFYGKGEWEEVEFKNMYRFLKYYIALTFQMYIEKYSTE